MITWLVGMPTNHQRAGWMLFWVMLAILLCFKMIFRTMALNKVNLEEHLWQLAQRTSTEPQHSSHVSCGVGHVICAYWHLEVAAAFIGCPAVSFHSFCVCSWFGLCCYRNLMCLPHWTHHHIQEYSATSDVTSGATGNSTTPSAAPSQTFKDAMAETVKS